MGDLSSLSNEQLLALRQSMAGETDSPTTPGVKRVTIDTGNIGKTSDLASMSDKDLLALRDKSAPPSVASDVVKSAGAGLAQGAAGLVGLPGDVAEYGARGIDWLTQQVGKRLGVDVAKRENKEPTFGSADVRKAIESVTGEFHKPQTTAGEYARTIGEFAPAALTGGGGIGARVAQTVIPALASETAGQLTKGRAIEPWARGVAGLAGGVGAAMASRPGTASRAIREQMPEGVTPQMVDQAQTLIAQGKQRGIDLSWPEALSQAGGRPVLTNTLRHLEASPQTEAQMAQFFGGRPQQVEQAVRGELGNISSVNRNPSTIGPAVGEAMEGTVNDVRGAINKQAAPFYKAAESIRLSPQDMAKVRALPGYKEARAAVRGDPQLNRYVSHLPDDSVGFLNEVKKQLDNSAKNAVGPLNAQPNMQRAAGLGKDAVDVRNAASNASLDYATALAVESVGREKYLKPLLDGPIGRLAKKDTATQDAINVLFPKNPLPNSEHEIGMAVSALAKRNPNAATDLVRAHVESVFNQAAKDLQTGANQAGGAKFRAQLVGNAQQRLNLREAVESLPNGADRWKGFNKFLDVLEATGTRQNVGSRTAYNQEINKMSAMGGVVGDAVKTGANPMRFGQKFVDRYEQYKLGKNLEQLATILTSPQSGGVLRAIAAEGVSPGRAQALATRLLAIGGASRPVPVNSSGGQSGK